MKYLAIALALLGLTLSGCQKQEAATTEEAAPAAEAPAAAEPAESMEEAAPAPAEEGQ
ncbi:MAG: hypothetical protein ACT4NU_10605 [Chromatiales bacterium]